MKENITWNNTKQFQRIYYRFKPYMKIGMKTLRKRVSPIRLITARYPFNFPDSKKPATLSLELTDACDLKCLYCNNPLFANPRYFMKDEVFDRITKSNQAFKIDRIRVGGGEPTLHPKFKTYSEQLSKNTKFLSIVTNAQWKKAGIPEALLSNYDLIEISVDAGGKENYESSRPGAKYELLIQNLKKLNRLKQEMGSNAHINLRFMIRPSNKGQKQKEYDFWRKYSDSIMPQHIIQHAESDYEDDVYQSVHIEKDSFPKCAQPFKDIQVRANGNIPLCQVSGSATLEKNRMIIGNILESTLESVWEGQAMTNIRQAHKQRDTSKMEVCRGCRGC